MSDANRQLELIDQKRQPNRNDIAPYRSGRNDPNYLAEVMVTQMQLTNPDIMEQLSHPNIDKAFAQQVFDAVQKLRNNVSPEQAMPPIPQQGAGDPAQEEQSWFRQGGLREPIRKGYMAVGEALEPKALLDTVSQGYNTVKDWLK